MGKYLDKLNEKTLVTDKSDYYREQYQSFMTGPEWRNVEMSEEFANYLHNGNSMFHYPYLSQVYDLWRITLNSYKTSRKYNSASQIIFSEYTVMDLFVTLFTTIELAPKGILSLLLRPFLQKENNTAMQQKIAGFYAHYAASLQTVPFFNYDYHLARKTLSKAYQECKDKTWVDWFSWKFIALDLLAREWISKPLKYWFNDVNNDAPQGSTDILVKFHVDKKDVITETKVKKFIQNKLSTTDAPLSIVTMNEQDQIFIKENKPEKSYNSVFVRIRAPRYGAFVKAAENMHEKKIRVKKIAGQDRVQLKFILDAETPEKLKILNHKLDTTSTIEKLYSYRDRIHPNRQFCLFDVAVNKMQTIVSDLKNEDGVRLNFIHNF